MDMLNTKDAARHVRLSPVTLERLRISGGGPHYAKLGKAVRYRKADLDDWVVSHLVRSTSQKVVNHG